MLLYIVAAIRPHSPFCYRYTFENYIRFGFRPMRFFSCTASFPGANGQVMGDNSVSPLPPHRITKFIYPCLGLNQGQIIHHAIGQILWWMHMMNTAPGAAHHVIGQVSSKSMSWCGFPVLVAFEFYQWKSAEFNNTAINNNVTKERGQIVLIFVSPSC